MPKKEPIAQSQIGRFNLELIKEYGRDAQLDGILNLEAYNNANPRILWILKEANWGDEYEGLEEYKEGLSDNDIQSILKKQLEYFNGYYKDVTQYSKWKSTFKNICYITYGVLQKEYKWDDIPDIDNNAKIDEEYYLSNVAFINVKKVPGNRDSNKSEISKSYDRHKEFIHRQIDLINPDIIINCSRVTSLFECLRQNNPIKYYSFPFVANDSRLIIDAYHPMQTQICEKNYVNNILEIVKDYINNQIRK